LSWIPPATLDDFESISLQFTHSTDANPTREGDEIMRVSKKSEHREQKGKQQKLSCRKHDTELSTVEECQEQEQLPKASVSTCAHLSSWYSRLPAAHTCYRSRHENLTPSGIIRAVYIAAVRDTVVTRDSCAFRGSLEPLAAKRTTEVICKY
jgi:hypothetical protein